MRANAATSSASPRAPGSTPASTSARSARSGEPANAASPARRVLRRPAKAVSITRNTAALGTEGTGGGRRRQATRPESTFGTGQNTLRLTRPADSAAAYHASFALGAPYVRDPGLATSRSDRKSVV